MMPKNLPLPDVAESAYWAYGKAVDNKNYQGLPMPLWAELPEKIQQAWMAAVLEVWTIFKESASL